MVNFGTIFRYNEEYYVYLIETDSILFAARIINKDITKQLIKRVNNPAVKANGKPMYCFVVLSTNGFKEQAAHYGQPELSKNIYQDVVGELNEEDFNELKEEIKKDSASPIILRETFKKMFP